MNERLAEYVNMFGIPNMTNDGLLSIMFGMGAGNRIGELLEQDNCWKGYRDPKEFEQLGISHAYALKLCALLEFSSRISSSRDEVNRAHLGSPDRVARYFTSKLRFEKKEHLIAAFVNVKNRMLAYKEICMGNAAACGVDVQDILRWGILYKAYGVILIHNHPSGFSEPSEDDKKTTNNIAAACKSVDLTLLDHVIIGDDNYVSLHDFGII